MICRSDLEVGFGLLKFWFGFELHGTLRGLTSHIICVSTYQVPLLTYYTLVHLLSEDQISGISKYYLSVYHMYACVSAHHKREKAQNPSMSTTCVFVTSNKENTCIFKDLWPPSCSYVWISTATSFGSARMPVTPARNTLNRSADAGTCIRKETNFDSKFIIMRDVKAFGFSNIVYVCINNIIIFSLLMQFVWNLAI